MSLRLICGLLAIIAGAGAIPSGVGVQQTRDAVAPPTVGTASIAGVVVNDQEPAQPVRRASGQRGWSQQPAARSRRSG